MFINISLRHILIVEINVADYDSFSYFLPKSPDLELSSTQILDVVFIKRYSIGFYTTINELLRKA